jgi:hypothetical protein
VNYIHLGCGVPPLCRLCPAGCLLVQSGCHQFIKKKCTKDTQHVLPGNVARWHSSAISSSVAAVGFSCNYLFAKYTFRDGFAQQECNDLAFSINLISGTLQRSSMKSDGKTSDLVDYHVELLQLESDDVIATQ